MDAPDGLKPCLRCRKRKPRSCFNVDRSRRDGLHPYCTPCKVLPYAKPGARDARRQEIRSRTEKRCTGCKLTKPLSEFVARRRSVDGRGCRCLSCCSEYARKRQALPDVVTRTRAYYRLNKAKLSKRTKQQRDSSKAALIRRLGGECVDCGLKPSSEWPLACFEFHHLEPSTKSSGVAKLTAAKDHSLARDEALKCVVLCANCHRRRHSN